MSPGKAWEGMLALSEKATNNRILTENLTHGKIYMMKGEMKNGSR
jgi:hypothetical protein